MSPAICVSFVLKFKTNWYAASLLRARSPLFAVASSKICTPILTTTYWMILPGSILLIFYSAFNRFIPSMGTKMSRSFVYILAFFMIFYIIPFLQINNKFRWLSGVFWFTFYIMLYLGLTFQLFSGCCSLEITILGRYVGPNLSIELH